MQSSQGVAVIDALRGSSADQERGGQPDTRSQTPVSSPPPQTSVLPRCAPEQLALSIETLAGQNAAVLRHVRGDACRLATLTLRVTVIDRHGRRDAIDLADAQELGDDYLPETERVVPFSICGEGAPFIAEARAGPYSTRAPAVVGGSNCAGTIRRRLVRFGREADTKRVTVEALDTSILPLTVRIDLPHGAEIDVWMQESTGTRIDVLGRARRSDCERHGARDVCLVRYGLLPGNSAGVWSLFVRKPSKGTAVVRLAIAFGAVSFGQG